MGLQLSIFTEEGSQACGSSWKWSSWGKSGWTLLWHLLRKSTSMDMPPQLLQSLYSCKSAIYCCCSVSLVVSNGLELAPHSSKHSFSFDWTPLECILSSKAHHNCNLARPLSYQGGRKACSQPPEDWDSNYAGLSLPFLFGLDAKWLMGMSSCNRSLLLHASVGRCSCQRVKGAHKCLALANSTIQ